MVTAVQAAVVAAAAAWVIGAGVAVYVMLKAARLMSETSTAVTGLRERGDLLIESAADRPLTWAAALVYGIRWAIGIRRPGRPEASQRPGRPGTGRADRWPRGLPAREAGRRAALTGRADGSRR